MSPSLYHHGYCVFLFGLTAVLTGCSGGIDVSLEDTIQLDERADLIAVSHLRVGAGGRMLIVDAIGRKVFLFDSEGILLKEIDPTDCRPDMREMPTSADISARYIFLSNSDARGYVFNADGTCHSDVDPTYRPFRHLAVVSDTSLAGIRALPDLRYRFELADILGKTFFRRDLPDSPLPASDEHVQGGGFDVGHEAAYFAPPISAVVYRIEPSGDVQLIDMSELVNLDTPEFDLPRSIGPNNIRHAENMAAESTRNEGVFLLGDDRLFVQYLTPEEGYTWVVFDPENPDGARVKRTRTGFMDVREGKGYHVQAPKERGGNPSVAVYAIGG